MRLSRRSFVSALATTLGFSAAANASTADRQQGGRHPWPTHGGSFHRNKWRPQLSPPTTDLGVEWKQKLGHPSATHGHFDPVVTENYVIPPAFGTVQDENDAPVAAALDREDGSTAWTTRDAMEGEHLAATETHGRTVVDDTLYVTRTTYTFTPDVYVGATVYALDLADGSVNWSTDMNDREAPVLGSPVVRDGRVIFGESDRRYGPLIAFNAEDGTQVWNTSEQGGKGYSTMNSPALGEDGLYIGCWNRDSFLQFESESESTPIGSMTRESYQVNGYSTRVATWVSEGIRENGDSEQDFDAYVLASSPSAVEFYLTEDPSTNGLKLHPQWQFDPFESDEFPNWDEEKVGLADPVLTDDSVVVPIATQAGRETYLVCLDLSDFGGVRWRTKFEEGAWCASADESFVYACTGKKLVVASLATGEVESTIELGAFGVQGPVLADDGIYLVTRDEWEIGTDRHLVKLTGVREAPATTTTTESKTATTSTATRSESTDASTDESSATTPGLGLGAGALATSGALAVQWLRSTTGDDET